MRIVGGIAATPYSWPAEVLVYVTISGDYLIASNYYSISKSFLCGGTLINRYTVLTAGHCIITSFTETVGFSTYTVNVVNPYLASQYVVYVGVYDNSFLSSGAAPSYPAVKMTVRNVIRVMVLVKLKVLLFTFIFFFKFIKHPNYDSKNYLNDIAILQLSNPVTLNQYVQIACLPNPSYNSNSFPPTSYLAYAMGWVS